MIKYKTYLPKISLVREKSIFKKVKINSSRDCAEYAYDFYKRDIDLIESFFLILLNQSNNTIGYVKISQGGITSTVVDVMLISKYAIESLAKSVILVHNHPSGSLRASNSDKDITIKIQNALKYFGINVLDHIILVPKEYEDINLKYFSFADECIL